MPTASAARKIVYYIIVDTRCGEDEVALVRKITGESGRQIARIEGRGTVNVVYVAGDLIVRLNAPDDTPDAALRGYTKEVRCIALATAAGVPSPEVVAVGALDGRAYGATSLRTSEIERWPTS